MKNCVLGAEQSLVEEEGFSFLFVVAVGMPDDRLLILTSHSFCPYMEFCWNFLQENVAFVASSFSSTDSVCGRKACESQM